MTWARDEGDEATLEVLQLGGRVEPKFPALKRRTRTSFPEVWKINVSMDDMRF